MRLEALMVEGISCRRQRHEDYHLIHMRVTVERYTCLPSTKNASYFALHSRS